MFSWLRKGLGTGIVTTRYPKQPESMPARFRGRPVLDADCCQAAQGCTDCVQACLPGALRLITPVTLDQTVEGEDGTRLVLDYGRCIMCGLCVSACPVQALTLSTEYELATTAAEDLCITAHFFAERGLNEQEE